MAEEKYIEKQGNCFVVKRRHVEEHEYIKKPSSCSKCITPCCESHWDFMRRMHMAGKKCPDYKERDLYTEGYNKAIDDVIENLIDYKYMSPEDVDEFYKEVCNMKK